MPSEKNSRDVQYNPRTKMWDVVINGYVVSSHTHSTDAIAELAEWAKDDNGKASTER